MGLPSSGRLRRSALAWLCVFGLACTAAHAQSLPPEVSRGLAWLQSQVQADGSLANETSSIATPLQNRSEAAQTFKSLSVLPANLADTIAGETEDNTEYLARRVVALTLAGRDAGVLVPLLSANQNLDGGFGGGPGYESDALDTAWALIALKSVNAFAPVSAGLGYLASVQAPDGSFSAPGRPDLQTSAIAVLAMRLYASEIDLNASIQSALAYLLAQESPTQQWGDSAFLTAAVYEAIHDFIPLEPTGSAVRTFVVSRQAAEGGWDSDPYVTAIALRALQLTGIEPSNPTRAVVKGKVIDGQTGLALDGVAALLSGPSNPPAATTSAGLFEFRDLLPGTYNLQLSLSQYGTITSTLSTKAGGTVDLGVLIMTKVQDPTTGTARGTVKDASTGLPLSGALVTVNGALTQLTDGAGNYQVSNVAPGTITVQANKDGYATVGSTGSVAAGGVFVFSPLLVPGPPSGAGATLLGTVIRASDRAPLAGVSITVSGASSASATTDAQGSYQITGLNPGATQVMAALAGYDSVSGATNVVANTTVNFSPVLYATATSPPNGNKASVTGVVMDSGTNAVLAGVSVSATYGTTNVQVQTGADGRFMFEGINTAEVSLSFSLSGYDASSVSVPLELLQALDIGQVRLRRSQVTQLLSDLTVKSLTRAGATTDPQTLAVSGYVTAVVANIGAASAPAGVQVIAFHDANRNGAYDAASDPLLGQISLDAELAAGAETTLLVPVSGQLPFRDAPINIWVDSTQSVVEQNEANNIASTAAAAQVEPSIGTFAPVLKWAWSGSTVLPLYNQVMSIPIVAPIQDTNGDGKIDQHDIPAVIFHTFADTTYLADGVLRAVSGRDGHELWTVTNSAFRTNPGGHLAVADIDGDGLIEIIAPKSGGGVIVFEHDGTFKWQSPVPTNNINSGGPAVADLDGDGVPEIIVGNTALNANGTLRWQGTGVSGPLPAVADLDMDGIPEVISGAAAYRNNGQLWWQNSTIGQGNGAYVAIGNLDADPFPEIVVVNFGKIWVLEHDGTIKWGPVSIPGGGNGGPPTIADMNGDGVPEIGVAGAIRYVVLRADGSILWQSPTQDQSSSSTGSSVFDFDGDGTAEVVYADERFLRVYNGKTGAVVFATPNTNGTLTELPVIADVDGDNHADIVVSANLVGASPPAQTGIRVFQDQNNSWVNTRRIWNEHTYHITNINDDGTVPAHEQNSWQVHNTYRLNKRLDISAAAVADLTASYLRVQDRAGAQPSTFTVRVGNGGSLGADTGVRVAFYNGQPGAGGVLLGVAQTTQALDQGVYQDVSVNYAPSLAGISTLVAVVDDDGTGRSRITDFDRGNNSVSLPLSALSGSFSIQVNADQPSYGANADVAITATVANAGSFDGATTVRFTIETADGMGPVATLAPPVTVGVPHGTNQPASSTWNTGTIFAGSYRVKAELVDSTGMPYAAAFAPFSITAPATAVSAKLTADKPVYLPSDTVQLVSRATNLTDNQPLDSLTVVTSATNQDGSVRFTQSEHLVQLVQGALKDYNYALPLAFAAPGVYAASLNVLDTSGAVLATSTTSFAVLSSAASGSGLTGSLSGTPKPVPYGDPIVFSAVLNNLGNADLATLGATITIVDPAAQQILAQFPATLALLRGQSAPLSATWAANATVGTTYVAVLSATVGAVTITLAQEVFMVAPPATRMTGTLAAIPKQVPQGDPVALNLSVINVGFGAISGLPLSVTVTDAATQQVVAQFTDSASIALAGTYQKAFGWPVTGAVGTNYTATLTATVDGVARTLAQDSFTAIEPPVKLDVTLERLKEARVLVLLSCEPDIDHDSGNHDHHVHGSDGPTHDHGDGAGHDHGHHDGHYDSSDYDDSRYQDSPDDQHHGYDHGGASEQTCIARRSASLDGYLAGLGVTHLITSTEADFRRNLRSGAYNTYWIAGGGEKLEHDLDEELREAVFRGGALILDRVHDERNHSLDAIVGANAQGKDNPSGQTITVTGPIFAAGSIATEGRPSRVQLTTGQAQAVFPAEGNEPAIVSNQYGQGRALLFAFDLTGTLIDQPASSALQSLVQAALGWVAPDLPATADAGGYTIVRTRITSLALAVDARVTLTLPAGAVLLTTAPGAALDASGRPVWTVTLDSGSSADLEASIRLPLAAGTYAVQAAVESIRNGQAKPYNSYNLTLAVTDAATVSGEIVADLQGLTLSIAERQQRDRAVQHVQSAQTKLAAGRYEDAIDELLEAVEDLMKITSVDISAERLGIDRMLDEAGYRWVLALP